MQAASALETANMRIDSTLQRRHGELTETLQRLSGKADQLDEVMHGYSQTLEGSIADTENRARSVTQQMAQDAAAHSRPRRPSWSGCAPRPTPRPPARSTTCAPR